MNDIFIQKGWYFHNFFLKKGKAFFKLEIILIKSLQFFCFWYGFSIIKQNKKCYVDDKRTFEGISHNFFLYT